MLLFRLVRLAVPLAFALGIALLAASAFAAPPAGPVLELTVQKVIVAQGKTPERRVDADAARAGDTLEYEAVYRNPTAQTIRRAQVTVPVPGNGVEYLLESAAPAAQQASRDGRSFTAIPLLRTRTGADGQPRHEPAPAADYRFLRWDLGDIAPGASRTVRARVQLLPVGSAR